MDINVNTVYRTVLSILNKEQRGYLTPDEFNRVATQVQLELFEKFFDDYNQYLRMPKTNEEFASKVDHMIDAMQVFEEYKSSSSSANGVYGYPQDSVGNNEVYRLGSIYFAAVNDTPEIEIVNRRQYKQQILSPLTQPSIHFPIGILTKDTVEVYPKTTSFNPSVNPSNADVKFSYIRKPKDVRWGYNLGSVGQYIYDNLTSPFPLATSIDVTSISKQPTAPTASTTTNVNTYTTTGSGVNATFSITTNGSGVVNSIVVVNVGSGFSVGDIITIQGNLLGGSGELVFNLNSSSINTSVTTGSTNFEIDVSQQTEVILEILKYSGIIIRDPQIIQAAQQELVQNEANEKR